MWPNPSLRICYLLSHYVSHQQAGRQFCECLLRLGVPLVPQPEEADVVVIHNELWSLPGYYRIYPVLHQRHVIAYAVWETDRLPEHFRFALRLADEIWTCSNYCREVLAHAGPPVSIVPHVVVESEVNAAAEEKLRRRLGTRPGEFLFYTIANTLNPRKGVEDSIRAFNGLFPVEQARLIVKSNVPLPRKLAETPGVLVLAGDLDEAEISALHRVGHCFVSAHRAEGWGLAISAAMANGRLVIATAHSGNMEYMTTENSLPVACTIAPIRPEEIARQSDLLSADMHWAYVDVEDLRRQMRRVFEERESLQPLAEQARLDMQRYSPERIDVILSRRLTALSGTVSRHPNRVSSTAQRS
jgi:glycosyltransferase involved in cell wall biosynthesis